MPSACRTRTTVTAHFAAEFEKLVLTVLLGPYLRGDR